MLEKNHESHDSLGQYNVSDTTERPMGQEAKNSDKK